MNRSSSHTRTTRSRCQVGDAGQCGREETSDPRSPQCKTPKGRRKRQYRTKNVMRCDVCVVPKIQRHKRRQGEEELRTKITHLGYLAVGRWVMVRRLDLLPMQRGPRREWGPRRDRTSLGLDEDRDVEGHGSLQPLTSSLSRVGRTRARPTVKSGPTVDKSDKRYQEMSRTRE